MAMAMAMMTRSVSSAQMAGRNLDRLAAMKASATTVAMKSTDTAMEAGL